MDAWVGFVCPVHGPYDPEARPEDLCPTVIKCYDPCPHQAKGESCVYCDHRRVSLTKKGSAMTFECDGVQFRIKFRHDHWSRLLGPKRMRRRRGTVCLIDMLSRIEDADPGKWITVGSGAAVCSFDDQFVKETGRRISLDRAARSMLNYHAGNAARACYYERKKGRAK